MPFETTTLSPKKGVFAALAVASVLLLGTGCSAGGLGGQDGADGSGNSSASDASNDDKDRDSNDSASDNTAAKECVVGNWWFFEGQELNDFMTSITLGAFSVTTTGFAILTVNPDGSTQTTYDHWVNVVMLESAMSTVERDGIDKGSYSISSNGAMTVSDTTIGSVTTWVTETGGETIEATGDPEPSLFSRGEFTCNGEELEITVDGATAVLYREH